MNFLNKGYWALILGGSSGIGLASAKKLASEGMNICIVHRDRKSALQEFETEIEKIQSKGVKCLTFNLNALKGEERKKIIETLKSRLGKNDGVKVILHSIAKGNLKGMTTEQDDRNWDAIKNEVGLNDDQIKTIQKYLINTEYSGNGTVLSEEDYMLTIQAMSVSYYSWIQEIFQAKILTENALALALTSEGNQKAWRNYGAVSAAKSSLESISRSIALELGPLGLRSNIIQAGVTITPSLNMIPGSIVLKTNALLKNPLKRMTTPEDVANAVYLLSLPEANWINGAIIPVDGGESIT